jgi:transposase
MDLEALLRIMVFNRLCDADSKLGALRWAQTASLPDMDMQPVEHQHLLRAMDALAGRQEAVGQALADAVRPLVDEDLSFIFYDITTIRVEGHTDMGQDLRRFGMSKEGQVARQFMLGLVQTAQGIPLYHEVFEGNAAEGKTLKATLQKVMSLFPVKRVIAVADRGLLSVGNLEDLQSMALPNGQPLEFILAVPGRRYGEFAQLLAPINEAAAASKDLETVQEFQWQGLRLVAAHDKLRAQEQGARRDAQIAELEQQAALLAGKLGKQKAAGRGRGRKLSEGGALAKLYHAVREARLGHIVRADVKSGEFGYQIDGKALGLARAMDGKLLLASNAKGLGAKEIIDRYKSLGYIEQGFRVLKSEIEIGPVYHRLPERIRAHATICFIALILHRVIRARLQSRPVPGVVSPERALASLRRIQTHSATLPGQKTPIRDRKSVV